MQSKQLVWIGMFTGSIIGSYIPAIWGAGMFSVSSIIFGALGAIAGIWFGFKVGNN